MRRGLAGQAMQAQYELEQLRAADVAPDVDPDESQEWQILARYYRGAEALMFATLALTALLVNAVIFHL